MNCQHPPEKIWKDITDGGWDRGCVEWCQTCGAYRVWFDHEPALWISPELARGEDVKVKDTTNDPPSNGLINENRLIAELMPMILKTAKESNLSACQVLGVLEVIRMDILRRSDNLGRIGDLNA